VIPFKRSHVRLLDNILRILVMLDDPTRKIVCGIQKRQENLFKPAPFFSHKVWTEEYINLFPG
jgi:hypothetical protein